jgi:DNA processing protein
MSQVKYFIGFNLIGNIGTGKFSRLENHFGSIEAAWHAGHRELSKSGIDAKTVESIVSRRPLFDLDDETSKLTKMGIRALTWNDAEYPPYLRQIEDCPPLLYLKGSILAQDLHAIAVVGARRATAYGKEVAERITEELVYNDMTVVSGLARGIDTVAHRTAVRSKGRTIAVMGCGLDTVYPPENASLATDIIENGAIISDYPIGTKPLAFNFPRRNRILSALSMGVAVIEATQKSGALITAERALEQNREVFAVPGSILSPLSEGTNRLIQHGAKLVRNAKDILDELNIVARDEREKRTYTASGTEVALLRQLSFIPVHVDEICRNCGMDAAKVSSSLTMLELKGIVKQVGGMYYMLSNQTSIVNA